MKKTVSALALAASIAFLGAGGAQANHDTDYPAAPAAGTVSDGTVAADETFTFSGTGFNAGEPIEMEVTRDDAEPLAAGGSGTAGGPSAGSPAGVIIPLEMITRATTKADSAGNFSYAFDLGEDGLYTLTATGLQSGHVVTAQVTVHSATNAPIGAGAPVAGGGIGVPLANTGLSSAVVIWGAAGLGAVLIGAGSVVAAKRRAALAA